MPARPYKPKDKAKAENAVLLVERWIMMRLRHQTFYTFKELNLAIRALMDELNQREMKQYGASRKALFEKLDKPALKPLPKQRYLYTETRQAKVGPDYHIEYRPSLLLGSPSTGGSPRRAGSLQPSGADLPPR